MRNFNTNQTRHFYINGIGDATAELGVLLRDETSKIVKALFFTGQNADGLKYRSDTIDPDKITSIRLTNADALATKLLKHTITVNTEEFADVAALAGKTVKLIVTVNQLFDYDDSNCTVFTVEHKVAAKETAAVFYKALADAIEKAMPKPDPGFDYFEVTSSASGLVLTEKEQKYVRGKLSGEPVKFSVAFGLVPESYMDDPMVVWGVDKVEASGKVVNANRILADLEYFAYGERGDYFRGNNWPNNVEPTYLIDPKGTAKYDVLSIEYYWSGDAENVQRSPRLIQVTAPTGTLADVFTKITNVISTGKTEAAKPAE